MLKFERHMSKLLASTHHFIKSKMLFFSYTDCESLFEEFAAVFVGKASCGVITEDDYNPLVDASITKLGPNKVMFISK